MASAGRQPPADLPIVECLDLAAWEAWLQENHETLQGVWLKFAKKASAKTSVTYGEAVEAALCFGWIDGQARGHDEDFYLQRFTPRRKRSNWSQLNRSKATRLIEEGRMRPAGLAQIEAARADGRWENAYEPPSRATVPEDFQLALDRNPGAAEFFATLTGQARYAFLYRLHHTTAVCKRAECISRYVELLSEGRTLTG